MEILQANSPVHRYKAIVAYDGTDFLGFQVQAQGRTVQGDLEAVLAKIAKKPVRIFGAGRTDRGVHATGQVIAFNLAWKQTEAKLQKALNVNLTPDIVVYKLTSTYADFHPRFDALNRQYRYTILNQPIPDVMRRRYTAQVVKPLNVDLMQRASLHLLGTYDFASFGRAPQGNNTVRTITQAEWQVNDTEINFYITANAFLYKMVRAIVGTLIQVGLGKIKVGTVKKILQAKDRSRVKHLALPSGLCLVRVNYSN